MSKLIWDAEGTRLYETGIKKGVLYTEKITGSGTSATTDPYGTATAWNGLSSVSESPEGAEAEEIYADDIKYLELRSIEKLNLTIEAYTYPDKFAECDGSVEVVPGVEIKQQTRKRFGLCYRTTQGNDTKLDNYGYKLHLIYGCMASPSESQYQTVNDSPEAIAFSWEVTTTSVAVSYNNVTYKPTARIILDSNKVGAAGMAAIEKILYGTDANGDESATEGRMPLPAEVFSTIATAQA